MGRKAKKKSKKNIASKRKARELSKRNQGDDLLDGNQRGLQYFYGEFYRGYDLEIEHFPVRDHEYACQLLELLEFCYDAKETLRILVQDIFASYSADEGGWTVPRDDAEGNRIDNKVYQIAHDLKRRRVRDDYVIGGEKFKLGGRWAIGQGDAFMELALEKEGIGRNDWGVSKSLWLPTFQMFRLEEDNGDLIGFEQRRTAFYSPTRQRQSPEDVASDQAQFFDPYKIVHVRHDRNHLYGRSVFSTAVLNGAWERLKKAEMDLAFATHQIAQDPKVLRYAEGTDYNSRQARLWRDRLENSERQALLRNLHLPSWVEASRLGASGANIEGLIKSVEYWRQQIIPAQSKVYNYPGLNMQNRAPREISRSPERDYARWRFTLCNMLGLGIRQVIDTELVLKLGWETFNEIGRTYRIIWPEWVLDETGNTPDSGQPGVTDINANPSSNGNSQHLPSLTSLNEVLKNGKEVSTLG